MKTARLFALFALLALCSLARADVPRTIAFQGTLKDAAGAPITGARPVTFTLYDIATEGAPLWTETQTVTSTNGLFAAPLGSVTPLALPFDKPYWVGIKLGDDAEMTPRVPLTSAPYALGLRSLTVDPMNGNTTVAGNLTASGSVHRLSLSPNGGGQLVIGSNPDDDCVYLEALSADDSASASNFLLTGRNSAPAPQLTLRSDAVVVESGFNNVTPVPGYILNVGGSAVFNGSDLCLRGNGGGVGNNNHIGRALVDGGPGEGLIVNYANDFGRTTFHGPIFTQTLTLTSSRRFKRDVQPLANALGTLSQLQGVSYVWDEEHGGKADIGFIAEEAGKVVPELVTWEPNGVDAVGMDYSHLTALTVEGIKEQQAQIAAQAQRIAGLEAENMDLKARMERLEAIVGGGGPR